MGTPLMARWPLVPSSKTSPGLCLPFPPRRPRGAARLPGVPAGWECALLRRQATLGIAVWCAPPSHCPLLLGSWQMVYMCPPSPSLGLREVWD